ncbi:MAG: DUF3696 domain-containing protein [Bacteroidota bacterium]
MIRSINLSNFKAFGPSQSVPIKPLTLIFGANSSGKSSILHSLLLAHEAFNTNELDVFKTVLGGDSVDLGGFHQYVYRRLWEDRRVLETFELDAAFSQTEVAGLFGQTNSLIIIYEIGRKEKEVIEQEAEYQEAEKSIEWKHKSTGNYKPGSDPCVVSYEIATKEGYLLKMSRRSAGNFFQLDTINDTHPAIRNLLESILLSFTTTTAITEADWISIKEGLEEIIPKLTASTDKFIPSELNIPKSSEQAQQGFIPLSKATRKADIISALKVFLPRSLNEIIRTAYHSFSSNINTLFYLGPLRSYPPRLIHAVPEKDVNWQSGGGLAWNIILKDQKVRDKVNVWLSDKRKLSTPYYLQVENLYRIDKWLEGFKKQLTEPQYSKLMEELKNMKESLEKLHDPDYKPEKWNLTRTEFGKLSELKNVKAITSEKDRIVDEKLYEILTEIEVPLNFNDYNVEEFIDHYMEDLASAISVDVESKDFLSLIDGRTHTVVTHRDVGVGISQVLPVLVYAYANKGKILVIEQPEIHLHPQLQAELGDVFIQSALGENKNTFILETHSEHLILRIMRRMRETFEGTLPEGQHPLTPKDVSILYVEPDGDKSIIREMPLNERGELVKSWPGGFFEEGLREVFA